jgi:Fe-S cluster assembly ATP-binding protein
MKQLKIESLQIVVDQKEIIHDISLTINPGEIHAIMGPNGSGKSTLANAMMGHPKYTITSGNIIVDGEDVTAIRVNEKAKKGLFLSMQYPPSIDGVTITNFLRTSVAAVTGEKLNPVKFHKSLLETMKTLNMDPSFAGRYLNVGFSGGEKKRMEILQLLILNPTYAILDETDSGLDVDALKIVAEGINRFHTKENGILLVTHYNRILEYVQPDFVHIMVGGKIVKTGGKELALEVEKNGYEAYLK